MTLTETIDDGKGVWRLVGWRVSPDWDYPYRRSVWETEVRGHSYCVSFDEHEFEEIIRYKLSLQRERAEADWERVWA